MDFTYPNGERAQIDHILINKKWKNSALNCEAYNTFSTIKSDHRIVTGKFRLSLRVKKNQSTNRVRYDWEKLLYDENIKTSYTVDVKNHFEALQELDEVNNANSIYTNIMSAHEEAAKSNIPIKEKLKERVPWENKYITSKREAVKETSKKIKHTRKSSTLLDQMKKDLDDAYNEEFELYIREKN